MAMPPEAQAQTSGYAALQPASFRGEEEKKEGASLGATQIFGALPFAGSPSVPTSPPSSPRYMTEASSGQSPQSPYKGDAEEVAYIDFGAESKPDEAAPLSSHFMRAASALSAKFPVATPSTPSPSASPGGGVSSGPSPSSSPVQQPTASLFEQIVEPEQRGFSKEAEEQTEDEQADLSSHSTEPSLNIVDEMRRVEDEKAARLHSSKPTSKRRFSRFGMVFFVLIVVAILAVFSGMWFSLSQQL
jgi:hypothetical protein